MVKSQNIRKSEPKESTNLKKSGELPTKYTVKNSPVVEGGSAIFTLCDEFSAEGGVVGSYKSEDYDQDYIGYDYLKNEYRIHNFLSDLKYSWVRGSNLMDIMKEWYQTDDIVLNPMSEDEEAEDRSYYASTKKSKSFSDMVKSQRAKNIRKRTGPEITASMDLLEDIAYLADACSMEAKSVADGIYEKSPTEIGFKCSPEEFKQKVLECKQLTDWLVDNIEFWTFM